MVVYGTGWYYPPYVYYRGYWPVYYPYHYTYGSAAYYNPYTGTFYRGATTHGPYGGMGRNSISTVVVPGGKSSSMSCGK